MSPVSSDAAISAAAGHPRQVPPARRWLPLRPLQPDGGQLGGDGASLEESLQEEEGEEEGGGLWEEEQEDSVQNIR